MEKLAALVVRDGALSASDAVGWIVRLCATLAPIHVIGVAHGRISAKAIQIGSPDCTSDGYLLDTKDLVHDPGYLSPERLQKEGHTPADDAWAIGVTLYRMLTGQLPFAGTSRSEVLERILKHPPSPLAVYDVGDDEIQGLLDRIFINDVAGRLSNVDELRDALVAWDAKLGLLPPLCYGRPDTGDDDDIEDEITTTEILNLPGLASLGSRPDQSALALTPDLEPPSEPGPAPEPHMPTPQSESKSESLPAPPLDFEGVSDSNPPAAPAVDLEAASDSLPQPPEPEAAPDSGPPGPAPIEAEPWPAREDIVAESAKASGGLGVGFYVLAVIALAIGMGGTWYLLRRDSAAAPSGPATTSTTAASSVTAAPSASASATASAGGSAAASAAKPPAELRECVAQLFPPNSFSPGSKLDFVCKRSDPVKGANGIRTQVVLAGGGKHGVTDAMREWSNIGWYGMAGFSVIRSRCCADPKPLKAPAAPDNCKLTERLEALGKAANQPDAAAAKKARSQYDKAAFCVARSGRAKLFSQDGSPKGGEVELFNKLLARAQALASK